MQEDARNSGGVTPTQEDAKQDATSKETVSDLDEAEATGESESGGGTNDGMPSPDGQFDSPSGGAGPGNETGPM